MSLVSDSVLKDILTDKSPVDKAVVGSLGARAVATKEERFFTFCERPEIKSLDADTQLDKYIKFSKAMAAIVKEEGKIF